jgi:hypothetical protein
MSGANMSGADMSGAYMANANMRNACMIGATLPNSIVRSSAPEPQPEPEPKPEPEPEPKPEAVSAAAERRRIEWLKRYENPNGTQTIYARDQDGRAWWLILHPDAPDTWTEVTPLPSYQEKP